MQNTLLALAIAVIVALVAALVGPLLIDWSAYRNVFETQASRLVGLEVRVIGGIDVQLLPSPRLVLHDIEIGLAGAERVRARALGIEFALTPMMRGEWRATEMHLDGPQLRLGLDAAGHVEVPALTINFDPNALTIERLTVVDGRIELADAANGASITLQKVRFAGEVRSLLGPINGEGAVTIGGTAYPYRMSAGRLADDGSLRLHVNVDSPAPALTIEADGALTLSNGTPKFEGAMSLTRPVGIAAKGGTASVTQPWRVSGKVKASAAGALSQDIEFLYGSEEQGVKLTGTADFKFGAHPRIDGVVSGRQVDLDRSLGTSDAARTSPAAAIRAFAEASGVLVPAVPVRIGVGIDQLTIGGGYVMNLRGDISSDARGWVLDHFEFRAPGMTQVRLSGHVVAGEFSGPAAVEADDPKALAAWLEGGPEPAAGNTPPFRLRGNLTLGPEKIAAERINAEFGGKPVSGRFVYDFATTAQHAKLDADLDADDLDIDAALAFTNVLLGGAQIQRPHDMTIGIGIRRAIIAGIDGRNVEVRLKVDSAGLQLDRLSVADLGGVAFSASGRIDTGGGGPYGALNFDLEAQRTATLVPLVTKFAPDAPAALIHVLNGIGHSKLHATLDVAHTKDIPGATANLALSGDLDAMRLNTNASVTGSFFNPQAAGLRINSTIDAPDADALMRLLGLGPFSSGPQGKGQLKILVDGTADKDLEFDVNLATDRLLLSAHDTGRFSLSDGFTTHGNVQMARFTEPPLTAGESRPRKAAMNFRSPMSMTGRKISFDGVDASFCGLSLKGTLAVDAGAPLKVDGSLAGDDVSAWTLARCALGLNDAVAWTWPSKPFAGFAGATGRVALTGKSARASLRFANDSIVIGDLSEDLAGGKLTGELSLRGAAQGLAASAKLNLAGADASKLYPAAGLSGKIDADAILEGAGQSPAALIASLHGGGKVSVADAQFGHLDPRTFDAVTRAADSGMPLETNNIADAVNKALDAGALPVKTLKAELTVNAGHVRLANTMAHGAGADLTLGGNLDLSTGALNARLFLTGERQEAGARPEIYIGLKGPVTAPARTLDVSQFAGWLTLRSVEKQAKQLELLQSTPSLAPIKPAPSLSPQN